jgi:class 3 adenylate cyclase
MAAAENLTIVFVDMAGYAERTARQSREENKALMRDFTGLLVPLIGRFGGKRIKTIGDAFLITFRSPTDGVRCGMAMMDAVADYNRGHSPDDPLRIRVALNVGEVRVEKNDVFGEAVNIAARIEELTPPGEIYFSGVVYLSMNKAEVASEHVGERQLKGIPEQIRIFRVPPHQVARLRPAGDPSREPGELPYGGMHVLGPEAHVLARMSDAMLRARYVDWGARARALPARTVLLGLAGIAVTALAIVAAVWLGTSERFVTKGAAPMPVAVNKQISEAAREALRAAHTAYFERRRTAAAEGYTRVLEMAPEMRHDSGLAANLVGTLGWAGEVPVAAIRKYQSPEMVYELGRRTSQPGRKGAQRAAALLAELGEAGRVDQAGLAMTDLNEAPTCEERLVAVKRLRELKEARALPLLKENLRTGFAGFIGGVFSKDKNACLHDEAKAAVAELEKLPQAPAPPS